MDISHGGSTAPAVSVAPAAQQSASAREHLAVTAAWSALFVAAISALRLTGLMVARTDDMSRIAPFGGWQLYTVAAAMGVACVAVFAASVRLARRRFRSLRGRTSYHRVAILAAIVPGLLLGFVASLPLKPALSWASDHTGAAARERAIEGKLAAEYRAGPPTVSYRGVSESDPRVALLLDPRALGPDWNARYDANAVRVQPLMPGELNSVRAVLHEQHWSGNAWHSDMIVMEEIMTFESAKDASRFSTTWLQQREPSSMTTRVVAGVRVNVETIHTAGYPTYHHAEFAHGRFAVLLYPFADFTPTSRTLRFPRLLSAAVARAT